jgi:hypothetical protein
MGACQRLVRGLLAVVCIVPALAVLAPNPAAADDATFDAVWALTDQAVANGSADYSWFWGPQGWLQTWEVYNGYGNADHAAEREVRYYDKSRMEVTNPQADPSNIYFVTNGLLTSELVSGLLQYADAGFEPRLPADVPVAGDPANNPGTPSYAAFARFATTDGTTNRAADRTGQEVTEFLTGAGQLVVDEPSQGVTLASYHEATGHNIASTFWTWMNDPANGFRDDIADFWLYVMGYPISEPYWIDTTVGGVEQRVLVQLFERRVLTYTAANDPPFQIEFGNIGQHYFRWRYGVSQAVNVPGQYSVAFSFVSGDTSDIIALDIDRPLDQVALTGEFEAPAAAPLYSPDGSRIAFLTDSPGGGVGASVLVMNRDGSNVRTLAEDITGYEHWSADGRYLTLQRLNAEDYIIDVDTAQVVSDVPDGYHFMNWAPEGSRRALLVNEDFTSIQAWDVQTGELLEIAQAAPGATLGSGHWLRGDRLVTFVISGEMECVVAVPIFAAATVLTPDCNDTSPKGRLVVSGDHTRVAYYIEGEARVVVHHVTGEGVTKNVMPELPGEGRVFYFAIDWSYHPDQIVVAFDFDGDDQRYYQAIDAGVGTPRRLFNLDEASTRFPSPVSISPAQ